jgi:hypothetical protein
LFAFSSGDSSTIALMPFRFCFSSSKRRRREALELVVKVSRASFGGDCVRWHPNKSVDFVPSMWVRVVFQFPVGSFHIRFLVCVVILLM